jgi:putative MATE family efflux protein
MEFKHSFHRALIALVVPIALQNLISAAVNSADIIMLAAINQSAMAAVSLAGQITFVLMLFYFGLSIGAGILAAQYWGKKDIAAIRRVLSIACMFSAIISLLFFLASFCFPISLMRIFTNDAALIAYGVKYQRTLSFSYLAMSLSQMYLCTAKSMEKVRFCAIVSSSCLFLNILLNAVCIFVLFPNMPDKAITGVAAATVTARLAELVCCVLHSLRSENIRLSLPLCDKTQKQLLHDYLRYTIPVQGNYIVWGCALAATAAIIGHVSSDMVAANAIASTVKNLAIVLCGGIAGGGSVLIGKYLGSGDIQSAKKAGNSLYLYALLFGTLAGITILLIKPFVFSIIELNSAARDYLNIMLIVCTVYCVGKSLNSTVIGGIFCAGGDSKFGFWCDTIVMWAIIIPLALLCAFVWHVSPVMLYLVLCLDEFIKLPAALFRFRQYRWLNNITRDFNTLKKGEQL